MKIIKVLKISIRITKALNEKIEAYMVIHEHKSMSKAIIELIEKGLKS